MELLTVNHSVTKRES